MRVYPSLHQTSSESPAKTPFSQTKNTRWSNNSTNTTTHYYHPIQHLPKPPVSQTHMHGRSWHQRGTYSVTSVHIWWAIVVCHLVCSLYHVFLPFLPVDGPDIILTHSQAWWVKHACTDSRDINAERIPSWAFAFGGWLLCIALFSNMFLFFVSLSLLMPLMKLVHPHHLYPLHMLPSPVGRTRIHGQPWHQHGPYSLEDCCVWSTHYNMSFLHCFFLTLFSNHVYIFVLS